MRWSEASMRVLPVMDLLTGQVVRGVAGRRWEYRPIESGIVKSTEPRAVARAFREYFGLNELYVADLDAIAGRPLDQAALVDLLDDGFQLWVDAGVGTGGKALTSLAVLGVGSSIARFDALAGPGGLVTSADALPRVNPVRSLAVGDAAPSA